MSKKQNKKLLTGEILKQAFIGSVKKLDPRYMIKNPVCSSWKPASSLHCC